MSRITRQELRATRVKRLEVKVTWLVTFEYLLFGFPDIITGITTKHFDFHLVCLLNNILNFIYYYLIYEIMSNKRLAISIEKSNNHQLLNRLIDRVRSRLILCKFLIEIKTISKNKVFSF